MYNKVYARYSSTNPPIPSCFTFVHFADPIEKCYLQLQRPLAIGRPWYRCSLHAHALHSVSHNPHHNHHHLQRQVQNTLISLPQPAPGTFSASTRIVIHNTTTSLAWAALTDFPAYAAWNPFVRSAVVVNQRNATVPSQYPVEGLNLLLRTQIPPLELPVDRGTRDNPLATQYAYEEITHVQPELGRLAWRYASDTFVRAERWQAVSDMGNGDVLYESREVFNGLLSGVVKVGFARNVQRGFEEQGEGLKMLLEGMA
jgi:hypothetical protein